MSITINGATPRFNNKQWLVVYQQENAPKYPQLRAILAPSTDGSLYYSGRLMSRYTEAHAPNASLINTFVNYDPESSNPDQAKATHVICSQWVNGLPGLDITDDDTRTATFNEVNVAPLEIGTTLYYSTVIANNLAPAITGFETQFKLKTLNTIQVDSVDCQLITIQGDNA